MEPKDILMRYTEMRREERLQILTIDKKIEQREKQIERLKAKREKVYAAFPNWVDAIIKPIAEEMLKYLPGRHYEILGPFGLAARVPVWFFKEGIDSHSPNWLDDDNCLSIEFRPVELDIGEVHVTDTLTDTRRYKQGTMGEMNGFNHPTVPMPDTIQGLIDFMNEQNKSTTEISR